MVAIKSPRERELRGRVTERLELPMRGKGTTLLDRFMAKVAIGTEPDSCWIWNGASAGRDPENQYGKIWNGKRSPAGNPVPDAAHRVSYELFIGPIPDGLEIDHLCRHTLCVNPEHLEPVTRLENQRRGFSPMQEQRLRTHCPKGHPLDEANTYIWHGMRRCRECNRISAAERRKRMGLQ